MARPRLYKPIFKIGLLGWCRKQRCRLVDQFNLVNTRGRTSKNFTQGKLALPNKIRSKLDAKVLLAKTDGEAYHFCQFYICCMSEFVSRIYLSSTGLLTGTNLYIKKFDSRPDKYMEWTLNISKTHSAPKNHFRLSL